MSNEETKLWVVAGRIPFDDDDTVACVEADDAGEAEKLFVDWILGDPEADLSNDHDYPIITYNIPLTQFMGNPIRRIR